MAISILSDAATQLNSTQEWPKTAFNGEQKIISALLANSGNLKTAVETVL